MSLSGLSDVPDGRSVSHLTGRNVFHSVTLPIALAVCVLVLALATFGVIAGRGLRNLEPVDRHLSAVSRLQQMALHLEALTIEGLKGNTLPQPKLEKLRRDLDAIIKSDSFIASDTPHRLATARAALEGIKTDPKASLLAAIEQVRAALGAEVPAHRTLLSGVRHDLALEFSVAGAALFVLVALGIFILMRMRSRVFRPLEMLEHLLTRLAKRDYGLASTVGVDPIVEPLIVSYNHLVNRLVELENESARNKDTLEQEVRTATETLLEQNRSLAGAERLAAVGEVAARIAHELRNPLAGMQLALANIRSEFRDRHDIVERIDLVVDELRRVTTLLNGLLDQSRVTLEPASNIAIGKNIDELLALVRYQIPRAIQLRTYIPEDVVCHLPKDGVRQALLNLILNAADAIGDKAGTITVRAVAADDKLELSVSDDGPGFPANLLKGNIVAFRTGRPGGTGLGLSIVSRLVRSLGGQMKLRNLEPHGACVRLLLPRRGQHA